jgi:xanthine dehydrogenase molybdenum-binding subunit
VGERALVTCAMPVEKASDKEIVTLEGVSEEERSWLADAFVAAAGLQCGFCIPGIALRAKHLLDKNPHPTRAEIAKAIDVHLCRCTGYTKILDAVELFAHIRDGEGTLSVREDGGVGERLARYQGRQLVLGDRPYVADMTRDDMLHGAVMLSRYARARVRRIDTSSAEAMPGVVAVATASDVPGERWYGLIDNDWPGFVAEGEEVRCVGDFLAAVAALDASTARAAAELVDVEYEVLDPVLDMEAAVRSQSRAKGRGRFGSTRRAKEYSTTVNRWLLSSVSLTTSSTSSLSPTGAHSAARRIFRSSRTQRCSPK